MMTALLKEAGREGGFRSSLIPEIHLKKKPSGWRAFPIFHEKHGTGHSQDAGEMMISLLLRYFYRGNIVFFFSIKLSYT